MKKGWQTKTLGEICDIERGGSPRPIQEFITTDPNGINWIKIGDATASGKYIYKTEEKIKPEGVKRSRMVYEGDFILSNSMSFGRPYIMKTTGCIHDGWLVLHQPKVDPDYLYHALSSDLVFDQFDRLAAGSTVRNLNIGLAKSVEIPYPPLAEQQRIVGLLDEAFEGLATAKANAEKNLQNARALFESHLQSVFTQRGPGWVEKKLGDVCHKITDGTHHSPQTQFAERAPGTFPYITSKNIRNNFMDLSKMAYIERAFHDEVYARCKPSLGDVLLTKDGANTGNVTLNTIDEPFSLLSSVCLIKTNQAVLKPAFLCFYLQSSAGLSAILGQMTGAAIKRIVLKDIKIAVIPFPPLKEQETIVATLNSLLAETQRLARLYERKHAALEALKKSLLHQAFTGEL